MKKISSILLTLFITLTFSNSAIAGHSEEAGGWWDWKDLWTMSSMYRCQVTYTQLVHSGLTKSKYITTQHRVRGDICDWGAKKLSKKIIKWLDKNKTNMISGLSPHVRCKKRTDFKWNNYGICDKEKAGYRKQILRILNKKHANQVAVL
jgi:hypothetical protein